MRVNYFEYLIVGGGPAGIQLAYFFSRDNRQYLLLERTTEVGAFFKSFPIHRKLISINKIYTGEDNPELELRHDWNSLLSDDYALRFKDYDHNYFPSPDNLCRYLKDFSKLYNLNIAYNSEVVNISRKNGIYELTCSNGESYFCKYLVIATGLSKPNIPKIQGIENVLQYNELTLDQEAFKNKSVLIIGKGNSGFETAEHLIPVASHIHICSPTSIEFAWRTHYVGNLRAVNNNFLDTYQLKSQNAVLDAEILSIEKKKNVFEVVVQYKNADEQEMLEYNQIICCTGFKMDVTIFSENCIPDLAVNDRFPKLSSEWESKNNENMFYVGTLTQSRDFKSANSGFIHGFRYNAKALNTMLSFRNEGREWPSRTIALSCDLIANELLDYINSSSAVWQQSKFFCAVVAISEDSNESRMYADIPEDYFIDKIWDRKTQCFIATLEFGASVINPFSAGRPAGHETDRAQFSNFLHPIIREWKDGEVMSEHHVIENLYGEWRSYSEHTVPLISYLKGTILSETAQRFAGY